MSCATPLLPTVLPATPVPTSVLTAPVALATDLISWLFASATRMFPRLSMVKCQGALKVASVPMAESRDPATPAVPARVVTAPDASDTARMTCPATSLTYRVVEPPAVVSRHNPRGALKLALLPTPSTVCAMPLPARVVIIPPNATRTRWLFVSAMVRVAPGGPPTTRPLGVEKVEARRGPSTQLALPVPAYVRTPPPPPLVPPSTTLIRW